MSGHTEMKLRNGTIVNRFPTIMRQKLLYYDNNYKNDSTSRKIKVKKCCEILQCLIDYKSTWISDPKYCSFRSAVKNKMFEFYTENEPELNVMVKKVWELLKVDNDKYFKM